MVRKLTAIATAAIASAGLIAADAAPAGAQAFYEDETVTVLVGFSPGGGTDRFARLVAENIGRHIEGEPSVIVQNMPGAGSVLASNFYVDRAPRDGTVLFAGTGQLLMRIILGLENSTARLSDFRPLMATPMGRITYASTDAGVSEVADVLSGDAELILGVPGIISTIDAVLGLELLGADFDAIIGYEGKSDTSLALQQGELTVDGQTTPVYLSSVQPLVEDGEAMPLFAQGLIDGSGNLVRDPAAPDIPTVAEVYRDLKGEAPSGPVWSAYLASVTAIGNGGKILMMHHDAPEAAQQAIADAVASMVQDPAFLEAVEATLEGYEIVTGDDLQGAVDAVAEMPESDITWLKDYLASEFEVRFD